MLCGWVTKPSKTRHHEGDAFVMGSCGAGVGGWVGGDESSKNISKVDPFLCFRKEHVVRKAGCEESAESETREGGIFHEHE